MKISLFGVSILRGTVYTSTIHFSLLPIHSNSIIAQQSDKQEFGAQGAVWDIRPQSGG